MGICFRCAVPLRHGVVRDLRDGHLTIAAERDHPHPNLRVGGRRPCEIEV